MVPLLSICLHVLTDIEITYLIAPSGIHRVYYTIHLHFLLVSLIDLNIKIGDTIMETVREINFVGVKIQENLFWKLHIIDLV